MNEKQIRLSLVSQLEQKKAATPAMIALVDDYITLLRQKKLYDKDIKTRGIYYQDINSCGSTVMKENPSARLAINASRQMLSILNQLEIKPSSIISQEEDDEYDL